MCNSGQTQKLEMKVMSLASYASQCGGFVMGLTESPTEADLDALRADCKNLGLRGWVRWFADNREAISDFLTATPSVRRKRKAWQEAVLRRRLTLGAAYQSRLAGAILRSADLLAIREGLSYRDMARDDGLECLDLVSDILDRWPFDDPNPFS
jgi:hypothetical protein